MGWSGGRGRGCWGVWSADDITIIDWREKRKITTQMIKIRARVCALMNEMSGIYAFIARCSELAFVCSSATSFVEADKMPIDTYKLFHSDA